jgi:hypothetical protein
MLRSTAAHGRSRRRSSNSTSSDAPRQHSPIHECGACAPLAVLCVASCDTTVHRHPAPAHGPACS